MNEQIANAVITDFLSKQDQYLNTIDTILNEWNSITSIDIDTNYLRNILIAIILAGAYYRRENDGLTLSDIENNVDCIKVDVPSISGSYLYKGLCLVPANQHINSLTTRQYLNNLPTPDIISDQWGNIEVLGNLNDCDNDSGLIYQEQENIYAALVILHDIINILQIELTENNVNRIFSLYLDFAEALGGNIHLLDYAPQLFDKYVDMSNGDQSPAPPPPPDDETEPPAPPIPPDDETAPPVPPPPDDETEPPPPPDDETEPPIPPGNIRFDSYSNNYLQYYIPKAVETILYLPINSNGQGIKDIYPDAEKDSLEILEIIGIRGAVTPQLDRRRNIEGLFEERKFYDPNQDSIYLDNGSIVLIYQDINNPVMRLYAIGLAKNVPDSDDRQIDILKIWVDEVDPQEVIDYVYSIYQERESLMELPPEYTIVDLYGEHAQHLNGRNIRYSLQDRYSVWGKCVTGVNPSARTAKGMVVGKTILNDLLVKPKSVLKIKYSLQNIGQLIFICDSYKPYPFNETTKGYFLYVVTSSGTLELIKFGYKFDTENQEEWFNAINQALDETAPPVPPPPDDETEPPIPDIPPVPTLPAVPSLPPPPVPPPPAPPLPVPSLPLAPVSPPEFSQPSQYSIREEGENDKSSAGKWILIAVIAGTFMYILTQDWRKK